jgi:hypothetical protein
VDTEGAFLGEFLLFIPVDHPVRTGLNYLGLSCGLLRVDDHDTVRPLIDGLILSCLNARRILALHTWHRHISNFNKGMLTSFALGKIHPQLPVPWLRGSIRRIIIFPVFVFTGSKTAITGITF